MPQKRKLEDNKDDDRPSKRRKLENNDTTEEDTAMKEIQISAEIDDMKCLTTKSSCPMFTFDITTSTSSQQFEICNTPQNEFAKQLPQFLQVYNQQNNHNKSSNKVKRQIADPSVLELIEDGVDEEKAIMAIQMSLENNVTDDASNLMAVDDLIEEQEPQLAIQMSKQEESKDDIDEIAASLSDIKITYDINEAKHLFDCNIYSHTKCEKKTECKKIQKIAAILREYQMFIGQQEKGKRVNRNIENSQVAEIILQIYKKGGENESAEDHASSTQQEQRKYEEGREQIDLVNDFNHLLKCHSSEFEYIYKLYINRVYGGKPCDLKTCKLLKRNQRDRTRECNDLYHTTENEEIVLQQILDRIQCYFFHTFDIGYKITQEEEECIMNDNQMTQQPELDDWEPKEKQHIIDGNDEISRMAQNFAMLNLSTKMKEKRSNYDGVEGLERLYSTQNRFRMYDFQNDKRRRDWKKGSNVEIFSKAKHQWMKGEVYGIKKDKQGEWLLVRYDGSRMVRIQRESEYVKPVTSQTAVTDLKYAYGYRFFYWSYYKHENHKDKTHDDARGLSMMGHINRHDANTGYTVGQLYVAKKYDHLEEELLKNEICVISKSQNQEKGKAGKYLRSDLCKKMKCARKNSAKIYKLEYGDPITKDHLVAIVVYCGYDVLQREFSQTFRKKSNEDEIDDIKKRHCEFHHLARLLREIVECYGMEANVHDTNTKKIKVYHGADKEFMFESLFAYVKGPFSTTTKYAVAKNFAGDDGIIIELDIDALSWTFKIDEGSDAMQRITCFPCNHLSDFSNEEEIFNIGGLNRFHFVSVLLIQANGAFDFRKYIKGLKQAFTGMTHGGMSGDTYAFDIAKTNEEKQMAFRLLAHQCFKHLRNHEHAHEFKTIPSYIDRFMDLHCKSIKSIHVRESRQEFEENEVFKWFFKNKDNDWIKLDDIMAVFPGVEHILYYAHNKDKSWLDIVLTDLLGLLKKREKKYYPRFSILVNPSETFENKHIPQIINEYWLKFIGVGWYIHRYATNALEEWNNKSFKVFTDEMKDNTDLKDQGMTFLKKYNVDKMLSICCKGAQNEGFNILDDWDDAKNLILDIQPIINDYSMNYIERNLPLLKRNFPLLMSLFLRNKTSL